MNKKLFGFLLLLTMLMPMLGVFQIVPVSADPLVTSWNDLEFGRRKYFNITNSGETLTNYTVELILHESGDDDDDTGNHLYLGSGSLQEDWDDIRFYDNSKNLLKYYVDETSKVDWWGEDIAHVYVKLNILPNNTESVYWIYWDDIDAVSGVDEDNTFTHFDNGSIPFDESTRWNTGVGANGYIDVFSNGAGDYNQITGEGANFGHAFAYGNTPITGQAQMWWVGFAFSSPDDDDGGLMDEGIGVDISAGAFVNEVSSGYTISYNNAVVREYGTKEWDAGQNVVASNMTDFNFYATRWSLKHQILTSSIMRVDFNNSLRFLETPTEDFSGIALREVFGSHSWLTLENMLLLVQWVGFSPYDADVSNAGMGVTQILVVEDIGILNYIPVVSDRYVFVGATRWEFFINVTETPSAVETGLGIGFYDAIKDFHGITYFYHNSSCTWTSPSDAVQFSLKEVQTGDTWKYVVFNVVFNSFIPDSDRIDLYGRIIGTGGSTDTGWRKASADYFSIYNYGGAVTTTLIGGTAGRVVGGDVFELYAWNFSSVNASIMFRNLQKFSTVISIGSPTDDMKDSGFFSNYVSYGIDFVVNGTWYDGLEVRISQSDKGIDDTNRWAEFQVWWYWNDAVIKKEEIVSFWDDRTETDFGNSSSRLAIDLWFNRMNASTVLGGRVSSVEYGLSKDVGLFGGFFSDWSPMSDNATMSDIYQNIVIDGSIISVKDIDMMRVHSTVHHIDDNGDFNIYALQPEQLDFMVSPYTMWGIDTPLAIVPMVPQYANQGWFGGLASAIQRSIANAWDSTLKALGFVGTLSLTILDGLTGLIGYPAFFTGLWIMVNNYLSIAWGWVGTVFTIINSISSFIDSGLGWFIALFTDTITIVSLLITTINDVIMGVYGLRTGITNIWETINFNEWRSFAILMVLMGWMDGLPKRGGFEALFKDINLMLSIFNNLFAMVMIAVNLSIMMILRVLGLIRG